MADINLTASTGTPWTKGHVVVVYEVDSPTSPVFALQPGSNAQHSLQELPQPILFLPLPMPLETPPTSSKASFDFSGNLRRPQCCSSLSAPPNHHEHSPEFGQPRNNTTEAGPAYECPRGVEPAHTRTSEVNLVQESTSEVELSQEHTSEVQSDLNCPGEVTNWLSLLDTTSSLLPDQGRILPENPLTTLHPISAVASARASQSSFTTNYNLIYCEFCARMFAGNSARQNLWRHKRWNCKKGSLANTRCECGKIFRRSDALLRHRKKCLQNRRAG